MQLWILSAEPPGEHRYENWTKKDIYFTPSSEFNAYLKQIKVILSAVKKISYFFTSDEYDSYFFTGANRGCFEKVGLNFFKKRSGMHRSFLTLRYRSTHVKLSK